MGVTRRISGLETGRHYVVTFLGCINDGLAGVKKVVGCYHGTMVVMVLWTGVVVV